MRVKAAHRMLVKLTPGNPNFLCQGKTPIICGGYHGVRAVDSCDCFALENGTWNPTANLLQCRRYSASAIVTTSAK